MMPLQIGRHVGIYRTGSGNDRLRIASKDRPRGIAAKRKRAGGHLVKNDAEREQVGARVQFLAAHLFGRHVGDRAEGRSRAGEMLLIGGERLGFAAAIWLDENRASNFGQSEVENLGVAASGHEDVGGLDVAMHDALGVRRIERVGDLNAKVEEGVGFQGPARHAVLEGLAVEQFHDDEALALMLANLVNGADVGMVERGRGAGFAAETLDRLRVLGNLVGQKLQGDKAAQGDVLGLIDDPHAAAAQLLEDAVVRDGLADHCARILRSEDRASQ